MKGRIFGTLFALPFFGVGVWMLWSISTTVLDAWEMRGWQPTPATLTSAGYTTSRGDDSDTYKAYATYNYNYFGQPFSGDRVSLGSGSDNIGDYQQDTGRRLSGQMARGETITILVNPDDPAEAIIDPQVRWGMVGFKSIFVFVFGGVGLGLLIAIWRAPKAKDKSLPEFQASPWLLNNDWQSPLIRSSSKHTMWAAWAFAALWCGISAPLPFVVYEEVVDKQNHVALAGLLFPIIGMGLIGWATNRTREWRRFGATPVSLDPFPGSIGGHVGGTVELNLPHDSSHHYLLTLTSIDSYMSGSGKDRSRRERSLWQEEAVAHAESTGMGTRLSFRFDVPEGLDESDALKEGDSYRLWRLNLRADIPGVDLDRDFEIPVYATAKTSANISASKVEMSKRSQNDIYDRAVQKVFRVRREGTGITVHFPMLRNLFSNLAGMLIGGTFAGVGAYLFIEEGERLFGAVFGGTGGLIAIAAFYMLFKSLDVTLDAGTIRSVRRLLGIPLRTREMRRDAVERLEMTSSMHAQSGNKHTTYYRIDAIDREANEIRLGEGFKGKSEAKAAERFLVREFGLRDDSREPSAPRDDRVLSYTTPVS